MYWHPSIYRGVLKVLYGSELQARWQVLVPLLRPGETVVDLCAGDGAIAALLPAGVTYVPVDANRTFVRALNVRGFRAEARDVRHEPIPGGDVVLMMGSLYHMIPQHTAVVEKMKEAARRLAVVVEPHINWAARPGLVGRLAQWASDSGIAGSHPGRLSAEDLDALAASTRATRVVPLARERILIYERGLVLSGPASDRST